MGGSATDSFDGKTRALQCLLASEGKDDMLIQTPIGCMLQDLLPGIKST